jgi:hypothetical protein
MKRIILLIGIFSLFSSVNAQESFIRKDLYLVQPINDIFVSSLSINNVKLDLPETNFIAIYDRTTMNYIFYPSKFELNFNLYSPRVANQYYSPIKMDSFNPYATQKPQVSILLGVVDLFLEKIQE